MSFIELLSVHEVNADVSPTRERRLSRWALLILLALLIGFADARAAEVEEIAVDEPFRVMILRNTNQYLPAAILQDQGMREVFTVKESRRVEVLIETMDTMWFDRSVIEPEFLSLFRKKYSHRKIDLLIAAGADALDFAQSFRGLLFPGVPIIFYNVAEDSLRARTIQPDIAGAVLRFDLPGTIDLARRLQPSARRMVVVAGASAYDRNWLRRAREVLRPYEARLDISYWTGEALQDLFEKLRKLPEDAMVLYLAYSDDGMGRTYAPADVVKSISAASAAPVYGVLETYLGGGIVGGSFPSFAAHGKLAGELALRVLEGAKPENLGRQHSAPAVVSVDGRELRRWRIDESRLPVGTEVRFRPPSAWEQYRWHALGALAIIALQAMLIAGLLLHRARRRHAESELRRSQKFMELSTDAGEMGLWVRDSVHNDFWANSRLRSMFGFGENEDCRLEQMIERIHPDDRAQAFAEVEQAQDTGAPFAGEFRVLGAEDRERWVAVVGRAFDEIGHAGRRTMGVVFDITQRKQAQRDLTAALLEIRGLKERLEEENTYLQEEISGVQGFDEIVGKSDALKYVLMRVEQVAQLDTSVLLLGETGVGKELIARAIHKKSSRSDRPLVKVNCAALPESLVESELFGHEKGAFTGADRQRKGRFELADGGTIMLDEVGELPPAIQVKLLRALQEGEFERVGGNRTIKVNVRVIAATNRRLADEVAAGRFRQDLFYRLNVYPITVPPLRQRREDIPLLVCHFTRQMSQRQGKKISEIPGPLMREFSEYDWPGNIRELQNLVERAVIVSSGGVLRLPEPLVPVSTPPADEDHASGSASVSTLDEAEREHILRALEATGWRIEGARGAAAMLNLHPSTLRSRMKKLGLSKVLRYTPQSDKTNLH